MRDSSTFYSKKLLSVIKLTPWSREEDLYKSFRHNDSYITFQRMRWLSRASIFPHRNPNDKESLDSNFERSYSFFSSTRFFQTTNVIPSINEIDARNELGFRFETSLRFRDRAYRAADEGSLLFDDGITASRLTHKRLITTKFILTWNEEG